MNSHSSLDHPKSFTSVIATTLMALAVICGVAACSAKPSAEESAAQTKVVVDQAVADAKKQMIDEQAKQDTAVAKAVANTKKEFGAEQRGANEKNELRAKQRERAIAARSDNYPSNSTYENKSECTHCGVVLSVNEIETEGGGSGLGVVAGGVAGGVLGNQVGNGTGRDLATIAGAIGGAFAGNKIEKMSKKTKSYNILVKINTGEKRSFNQATAPDVVSGDKVKIENDVIVKM